MYYKIINNGYLIAVGTGAGGIEITAEEYENILTVIKERPTAEAGYDYRLKEDLTWELYECPVIDDGDEISDSEALDIIVGGDGV